MPQTINPANRAVAEQIDFVKQKNQHLPGKPVSLVDEFLMIPPARAAVAVKDESRVLVHRTIWKQLGDAIEIAVMFLSDKLFLCTRHIGDEKSKDYEKYRNRLNESFASFVNSAQ